MQDSYIQGISPPCEAHEVPPLADRLHLPHAEMTASEDMALEDVHDMQRTWHDDPTSAFLLPRPSASAVRSPRRVRTECIFIILDKSIPEENPTNAHSTQKFGTHRRPTTPAQ